jgi:hypothetical protein
MGGFQSHLKASMEKNVAALGVTVTYTPKGAAAIPDVDAVFSEDGTDREHVDLGDTEIVRGRLSVPLGVVSSPGKGDAVSIPDASGTGAATWTVSAVLGRKAGLALCAVRRADLQSARGKGSVRGLD